MGKRYKSAATYTFIPTSTSRCPASSVEPHRIEIHVTSIVSDVYAVITGGMGGVTNFQSIRQEGEWERIRAEGTKRDRFDKTSYPVCVFKTQLNTYNIKISLN